MQREYKQCSQYLELHQQSQSSQRSKFSTPITLPSGRKIRVFDLTNQDIFIIAKYCENDDFDGFVTYMTTLIPEFENLGDIIDKIYALIFYRSMFIDPEIQVSNADKNLVKVPIHIILSELEKFEQVKLKVFTVDAFTFGIGPLVELPGEANDVHKCIHYAKVDTFELTTNEEVQQVLDILPPKVFSRINQEILNLYKQYDKITLIPGNSKIKLEPLTINLASDQLQQLLLSLFKRDLSVFIETVYVFSQHFKNIDFFKLSPLDSQVLENILHRELKRTKEDQTPQHSNPLTPQ